MIKRIALLISAVTMLGCANSPRPVQQNTASEANEPRQTTIAHSSENQAAPVAATKEKRKWSQSGDAIDTTELDKDIDRAKLDLKAKPTNGQLISALSEAYFKRAVALTDARQYAAALGDYRKAAKLEPSREDARQWIDKIILIYDGLNMDYPKEGEEPPALPFKKGEK